MTLTITSRAYDRRFGRRNSRGGGSGGIFPLVESSYTPDAEDATIAALTPYCWLKAAAYESRGSSIVSFRDLVAPGTGIRAVTAAHKINYFDASLRAATSLVAADAGFNNAQVLNLGGLAVGDGRPYDSTAPASAWIKRHNGAGWEEYHVIAPVQLANQSIALTMPAQGGATTDGPGTTIFLNTMDTRARVGIHNATDRILGVLDAVTAVNTPSYFSWSYAEGAAPTEIRVWNGSVETTGSNTTAAPAAGDPFATLRMFGTPTLTTGYFRSKWGESLYFDRVLSDPDRATVQAYMLARYGLS